MDRISPLLLLATLASAGSLFSCTAELGQSGSGESPSGSGSRFGGGQGEGVMGDGDGTGPRTLSAAATDIRRLRKVEITHSVRRLLPGLPSSFDPSADVPKDNHVELAFAVPGTVSEIEVKRFSDMAAQALELLGTEAPGSSNACSQAEDECARAFIIEQSTLAFRRPPLPEEVDDLWTLYSDLRDAPDAEFTSTEALNVVVEALLQSPGFLYRWELGPRQPSVEGDLVSYTSYELASRLSFFLWNAPPDAELLAAAESGGLASAEGVEAQARRMMEAAAFDEALGDFATQWLEVTDLHHIVKDEGVYPGFNPTIASSMFDEARTFSQDTFRGAEPTIVGLLTGTRSRISPELAEYYGVTLDAEGYAELADGSRRGILMQGAVLAAKGNSYRTSPVRRGKFILNRLLCANVPPPPPDAVVDLPPADPNLTLREQLALHASSPSCNNCHGTMDPLGLAFEHFDGAGAFREIEGTLPIDASGELSVAGEPWQFQDAQELVDLLVAEDEVKDCFARQWVRYALGRFEQPEEEGAVLDILDAHEAAELALSELIVSIVKSKPFTHRKLREGEVTQP